MKKFSVLAIMAIGAATLMSCGNSTPTATLKNEVDTMSYAIGMAQTQGLKPYLVSRLGVDTTYMDDFIRGLNDGASAGQSERKTAYYAGLQIGQQISNQMIKGINHEVFGDDSTQTVSLKNFLAGFVSGVTGKHGLMTVEQAGLTARMKMETIKSKNLLRQFADNKEAGEKFMAENAKKDSIITLPSGVQYKIIKQGNGPIPADSNKVEVRYEGRTIDGNIFDSTAKNKQPRKFRCNQVIKGWSEALTKMPVGSEWEIYVPQELAYGERQQAQIKPFSALIFKVKLIDIVPDVKKEPKAKAKSKSKKES